MGLDFAAQLRYFNGEGPAAAGGASLQRRARIDVRGDRRRPRLGRWSALAWLLLAALAAVPAWAQVAGEAEYRTAPHAAAAEKAARAWLAKGSLGKAINWVERMVRSPGVTPAQQSWAAKVRADLRWQLVDLGLGPLAITAIPSSAEVSIDGKDLLPRTGNYLVWLQEGSHQLLVVAEDHAPLEQLVTVARGEKRSVEARLTLTRPPRILLRVAPLANLWIDGKALGSTARDFVAVSPGPHLIELRAPGHRAWVGSVDLAAGQSHLLQVQLEVEPDDAAVAGRVASDVRRPVTAQERGEGAERSPDLTRDPEVSAPGGVTLGKPGQAGSKASGDTAPAPAVRPAEAAPAEAGPSAVETVEAPAPEAAAAPWSDLTKGWLLGGSGLGLMAGGAVYAILAAQDAEAANRRPYGDPDYRDSYQDAAARAYLGYGVAGAGALLTGWGSVYLLGNQGLSRSGRGWLLTGTGLATAGVAGWMLSIAVETAQSAASLPAGHPEIDRRIALAQRDQWTAYGVAGAGAALVGVGLWQFLTSGSAASLAEGRAAEAPGWSLAPQLGAGRVGAAFTATW